MGRHLLQSSLRCPSQNVMHFTACLTSGASDASSSAWVGGVYASDQPFTAGGVPRPANEEQPKGIVRSVPPPATVSQVATRSRCSGHRPVVINVTQRMRRGRLYPETRQNVPALPTTCSSTLSIIRWSWHDALTEKGIDTISLPSRDTITRLRSDAFRAPWEALGLFDIDLMACAASTIGVGPHSPEPAHCPNAAVF